MLKRIIPCLDVKDGRVVKGINFEDLRDAGNPVLLGKEYYNQRADELVFLDIVATRENRSTLLELVKAVADEIFIPFTVGGGVRNIEEFSGLFLAGADRVSINSAAVANPELIKQASGKFGSQAVVVAIDVKRNNEKNIWEVYVEGGTENTKINLADWLKTVEANGAGEILLTSMDRDGTNAGFDLNLLKFVVKSVTIPVIASGGGGDFKSFKEALDTGASSVLAASVFHYGKYTVSDLKDYLYKQKIEIRP
ncbi:imidazole glycerol phosphate synthase subunit HisF [Candidatus Dojkabacteria bacterium]|nr:imidazole glycerol phosphate synthase subunit HisF [Candidatus Dojkabacteria bacterium]